MSHNRKLSLIKLLWISLLLINFISISSLITLMLILLLVNVWHNIIIKISINLVGMINELNDTGSKGVCFNQC